MVQTPRRSRAVRRTLAALAGLALGACAPDMPVSGAGSATMYDPLETSAADADGFELMGLLSAARVLPEELARGPHHRVSGAVQTDGFTNTYVMTSEFGEFEVSGIGLLRKRVHEIEVLAALREQRVSGEKVYLMSVVNSAEQPIEGAAQLLLRPLSTARDIPSGMWAYAQRIVEMTEGERTYLEDDYGKELMGFGEAKREWAYRLGVDVYTANPVMQETLDRFAWIAYTGGLSVRAPLMVVSGGAGIALTVTTTAEHMKRELRDRAPEEVRSANRDALLAMGVSEATTDRFTGHPWYSPTRQLELVSALGDLSEASGHEAFVAVSALADEPHETFFFARMALMLAGYNNRVSPIVALRARNALVLAHTADGDALLPLYMDHGLWTEPMQRFFEVLEATLEDETGLRGKVAIVSGTLSQRTREAFVRAGWQLREGLELTWLADHDAEMFAPGEPDPERIIPELGP